MRVFVTGASGHVGSAVVPELLAAGHEVVGLARSDASAAKLTAAGAGVRRGDLDDLAGLAEAAAAADGVIHLAFKHDAMQRGEIDVAGDADLAATQAIGDALAGTGKPFVTTSGTALLARIGITGRPGTEDDAGECGYRIDSENLTVALAARDVRSSVVRLTPTVHSHLDTTGFLPGLIAAARATGETGYVDDGANRWPAVHTLDAARVYRLALERAEPGSRLHAVGDEGVPFRDIAAAIGRGLDVPVRSYPASETAERFGFLAGFVTLDNPTSSAITRAMLNWAPEHPGLLADLAEPHYFAGAPTPRADGWSS